MKILSVGAELLHADGRTDRLADGHDEALVNSANALNKWSLERHLLTVGRKMQSGTDCFVGWHKFGDVSIQTSASIFRIKGSEIGSSESLRMFT
jgi:hypothetical protein